MKLYHKILVSILITTIAVSLTIFLCIIGGRANARKECASELAPDAILDYASEYESLPSLERIDDANLKYKKCLAEKGIVK